MSDLDDLLDQLYPGNVLANPTQNSAGEVDLDGLMDELTIGSQPAKKAPASKPKGQIKSGSGKTAAKSSKKQAPTQMDEDLDSLINDLTDSPGSQHQQPEEDGEWEEVFDDEPPVAKQQPPKAKGKAQPVEIDDDLDSLLGDLTGGAPAQAPSKATPKSTPRTTNQPAKAQPKANQNPDLEDGFLDELMGDLTGQPGVVVQTNKKPGQAAGRASVSMESIEIAEIGNLDSLMDELTGPQKPQPAKGRAQQQKHQSARASQIPSDLDSIMAEFGDDTTSHGGANDDLVDDNFESFLGQLESVPTKKGQAPGNKAAPKAAGKTTAQQKPTATKTTAAKSAPLKQDLESLMNDLTTGPDPIDDFINTNSKQREQPAQESDDFDDLMSSFEVGGPSKPSRAPVKSAQPTRSTRVTQTQPQVDNEVDDIYRDLDQPIRGSTVQPARSAAGNRASNVPTSVGRAAPANSGGRAQASAGGRAAQKSVGDSDLDSILVGLDEPSKAAPGSANRGPQKPPEAALPKGVCSGCRKPVTGEAIHALGRSYHPDHFMCSTCGKAIGTGSFYEKEGQPQCDRCYQAVFCKKCANCNLPITTQLVTALGQPWHPKCFVCTGCRGPFPGGSFFERDGRPYCSNCFSNVFNATCRRCGNSVNEGVINALGSSWHDFHFNCEICGVTFPDGQFWELDGNPYCESHYREQLGDY